MCLEESVGFVCKCQTWWLGLREIIQVKNPRAISGDREGEQQLLLGTTGNPQTSGNMNATGEDLEI